MKIALIIIGILISVLGFISYFEGIWNAVEVTDHIAETELILTETYIVETDLTSPFIILLGITVSIIASKLKLKKSA